MNAEQLRKRLEADEGRRTHAYQDTRGIWTIGIGHAYVTPDTIWTDAEIDAQYDLDVQHAIDGLDRIAPWWRGLDAGRQNVLIEMCFQMGPSRLSGFRKMLAACAVGDWDEACAQGLDSEWAKQVPARAARTMEQLRTGVFA